MGEATKLLTTAQAIIEFLQNQWVERDGKEQLFFGGCLGIFGHGNVGGMGQALYQYPSFRYYQARNEQSMVHTAIGYAKMKNRLGAFACTTSIGPGATNMLTGAATATINRLPVLLLPGDIFASRQVDPVLQQLEFSHTKDVSVNDCFKPVSAYWDRINRPEQLISALMQAMRVLTSPAETGAVTLSLPQDVQAMAYAFPSDFFNKRVWHVARNRPDASLLQQAAAWISRAKRPVIVAGGGVLYSGAEAVLRELVRKTGIPVVETFAGKGSLDFDDPRNLGAGGVTGTPGAIECCKNADLVIGIGTRYSDFTTVSQSAFQFPKVRFININVTTMDAYKEGALPLTGDARETILELGKFLKAYRVTAAYERIISRSHADWNKTVNEICSIADDAPLTQAAVIGAVNRLSAPWDVVVGAAGSLPGDLHKLWAARDPKSFHLEYGYSCMGYEIAGGLGVKIADPSREVFIMVGDGSYLMLSQEIVTSIQENYKLIIILFNNNGYASIGSLSRSLGMEGFGTFYRYRDVKSGQLNGAYLPVDLAKNAESLGAKVLKANNLTEFETAFSAAKVSPLTTVIYVETDSKKQVKGYTWWEVPVAQEATAESVRKSSKVMQKQKKTQRYYL